MCFKYEDNRVTQEKLEDIKRRAKEAPKSQGMRFWYMSNHYGNLYFDQQAGYHWYYLSSVGLNHCTCGLVVARGTRVEAALGHRNLPSFQGTTPIFINCMEYRPDLEIDHYGAYCQLCKTGSLRNLTKDEVEKWIDDHKSDCFGSDKLKGLS